MRTIRELPDGVKPYASSPVFDFKSVPDKLLKAHMTKDGVWGRLNVMEGTVEYFLEGQTEPIANIERNKPWIIMPTELHYVRLSQDAKFQVEFCR